MLLVYMGLLNMVGPVTPTIPGHPYPTPEVEVGGRSLHYDEPDENEMIRRKLAKMIKMQDEQILEIIKIWVQEND